MNPDVFQFPCSFPIKAIGKDTGEFHTTVVEIIRHHVPDLRDENVTTRPSAGGKYIAVTATFTASSRAQLDALYRELSSNKLVLMLL